MTNAFATTVNQRNQERINKLSEKEKQRIIKHQKNILVLRIMRDTFENMVEKGFVNRHARTSDYIEKDVAVEIPQKYIDIVDTDPQQIKAFIVYYMNQLRDYNFVVSPRLRQMDAAMQNKATDNRMYMKTKENFRTFIEDAIRYNKRCIRSISWQNELNIIEWTFLLKQKYSFMTDI